MASKATVKSEVIVLDGAGDGAAEGPIAEDDLQRLSPKHAAKTKFPPGCPVWHSLASSSSKQLDGRHGIVGEVFVDLESGARVYKLEGEKVLFRQHQLAYAMNCPVNVKGMVNNHPNIELEGRIVCPKPGRGGKEASYSVQFVDGNRVSVKLGVDGNLVACRKEAGEGGSVEEAGGAAVKTEQMATSLDPATIKSCLKRKSVDDLASDHSQQRRSSLKQKPEGLAFANVISSDTVSASTLEREVPSSITCDSASKLAARDAAAAGIATGTRPLANDDVTNANGVIDIAVPLWLQRDKRSQERVFFCLIDKQGDGRERSNVTTISQETNCHIRVNFYSRGTPFNDNRPLPPMTITVRAHNYISAPQDLDDARRKITDLLLGLVGKDGSRGRLVYDMAKSCRGIHRSVESTCDAVRSVDPFGEEIRCRFIAVLELPYHFEAGERKVHAAHLVKGIVQHRLRTEADTYIKVAGGEFRVPVSLCDDCLLVMGSSVQGLDKGVEILKEVNMQHMRSCFCKSAGGPASV